MYFSNISFLLSQNAFCLLNPTFLSSLDSYGYHTTQTPKSQVFCAWQSYTKLTKLTIFAWFLHGKGGLFGGAKRRGVLRLRSHTYASKLITFQAKRCKYAILKAQARRGGMVNPCFQGNGEALWGAPSKALRGIGTSLKIYYVNFWKSGMKEPNKPAKWDASPIK